MNFEPCASLFTDRLRVEMLSEPYELHRRWTD